jgi:hypothetical protein
LLARAGMMLLEVPDLGNVKIGAACGIAPTLRTEREEWGTHFFGSVRVIERLGHPPTGTTATEGVMTIFDAESPLSDEEIVEVRQYARERIGLWRQRSLYSVVALLLSCASVIPFSKGHSLHAHAEPFGRLLVYLSMALLVVCVYCTGLFWSAWQALRDVEKGQK